MNLNKFLANLFAYKYDEDIFDELQEFAFAINLYWALSEGYMSELSSRKYAMENSSRNASNFNYLIFFLKKKIKIIIIIIIKYIYI